MLKDAAPKGRASSVHRARTLRKDMSLPEVLLWQALRKQPSGLKFRRQHPSGPYILDFFCADARLAIEIDGRAHDYRAAQDAERDAWLARAGVGTLRLPASVVLNDLDGAIHAIAATAKARLPLHHPAPPGGPPPRDKLGED